MEDVETGDEREDPHAPGPAIGIRLALAALARRPPPSRALSGLRAPPPSPPHVYLAKVAIGKEADESVLHARAV